MKQIDTQRLSAILKRLHPDLKSHRISLEGKLGKYLREMINGKRILSRSNLEAVFDGMEQSIDHETASECLTRILIEECHFHSKTWKDSKGFCLMAFDSEERPKAPSEHSLNLNDYKTLTDRWFPILTLHSHWNSVPTLYGAPIPIRELYTELYLIEDSPLPSEADPAESYFQNSSQSNRGATHAVESVLAKIQHRAVFIGDPGTGKSTLCKWMARYLVEEFQTIRLFPVPLRLHDFAASLELDPNLSLVDYFLGNSCQFEPDDLPPLRRLFSPETKERFLFILDGWDEVPTGLRSRILSSIEETSLLGRILVTSRPSGTPSIIAKDADIVCQIGPLSDFAIRSLVSKVCGRLDQPEKAVPLFQQIDHFPQLGRLASNPFTLTLLTQIVCQGGFTIEELRTPTLLFEKAVQLIQREHNSSPHLPQLGSLELDLLRKNAEAMSFSPNGKQLQRQAVDLIPSEATEPSEHPVLKSRFLTQPSEHHDAYCYLHLQLQEFFAGQHLATLPEFDLQLRLENFGTSWDFLEEWRFTAGSLKPNTPQWKVFWNFWQDKLQDHDLFGGIYCLVAQLVAESEQAKAAPWSRELVKKLWANITEQGWRDPSISALIVLDPLVLVDNLKEKLCADTLKRVFNLMPQGLQHETGLYEWISNNPDTNWLIGECAPSLNPPSDLPKLRRLIHDPQFTPKERLHALQMTTGYFDEESVKDAKALLDCSNDSVFEEAATRLGTIGGPEAAMILARQLSIEVDAANPSSARTTALIGALSAPIYSAMEAHSRDYLLGLLNSDSKLPITLAALDALRQCPMGIEAEPIVRILETSNDSEIRQAACNALAKCSSPQIIDRCLNVAKTTTDPKLAGILLRSLINGKPDLSRHFSWLLRNIEDPNRSHWQQAPFFGLLRYAQLSPLQSQKLARLILPTIRSLTKADSSEKEYAHLDACYLLQGSDKQEAMDILGKILIDPDYYLSHRQQACSILAENPSPETRAILITTLKNLRQASSRVSNDTYFERALISSILKVAPNQLLSDGWGLKENPSDLLFEELRNWSEENLVMI